MKFDLHTAPRYRQSIEDAFQTILAKGNERHRQTAQMILDSEMLVRVAPVEVLSASGRTGLVDRRATSEKIALGMLSFREALGEIYITIAEETIDTGGQRGCEGTFVHENQHAIDFARTIESFASADLKPLSVFDPSLYELEWAAHLAAGEYMLQVGLGEYLEEGLSLMILGQNEAGFFLDHEGIKRRLQENYGLSAEGRQGPPAGKLLGIKPR